MGRRVKKKRKNGDRGRRGGQTEGGGRKVTKNKRRRREERGASKRASGGGGKRRGVRQSEEVRENRSDRQEVNGRCGRGRREVEDRGGRGDSGRGDKLRRLRTQGERRRSEKLWSYYNYHSSRERQKQKHGTVRQDLDEKTNSI